HRQGSGEFVEVLTKDGGGYHLAQMIRRITFDLARAGACGAGELARAAVRRAVGLGCGLTPSGDDFLTGLVAATYMCLGSSGAARRLAAAVEEASDSTSLLARFMLRAACRGRFCEPLAGLVGALARGDRPAAEEWVRAITHVGATSGEDMLAGVLLGLSATEVRGRCYETSAA
ncbi:MAG TPA: DUF2877 domain-containing protein, partial [bacterium]|nr:DUF2877 domain-containing protein [bacterium]